MREARPWTLEADRSGPETYHDEPGEMTLAERFISAFRLPYVLGCFLFGFVVFGFLNSLLAKYVESASLPMALQTASSWQYLAEDALFAYSRSEEHTSELQSQSNLVCRLLLETNNTSNTGTLIPRLYQLLTLRIEGRHRGILRRVRYLVVLDLLFLSIYCPNDYLSPLQYFQPI